MKGKHIREQQHIIQNLLSYLQKYPHAADSAQGIADWWVKKPLNKVLPVLEFLVGRNVMEQLEIEDAVIYRRALGERNEVANNNKRNKFQT